LPAEHYSPPALAGEALETDDDAEPMASASVLCIDDNPVNLKLVAQILGMRPHLRLITAHAPELGIELALGHLPDLILLDINMPGMDGYQVLDVLKSSPRLKHIPVVAVTANAMPRDIARGKQAGFADYLTKPLHIHHFLQVLDALLATPAATVQALPKGAADPGLLTALYQGSADDA
jgi:CheY-like chemotaxis protein